MREAIPFVLLACACGATLSGPVTERASRAPDAGPTEGGVSSPAMAQPAAIDPERDARFRALRSRAGAMAPGMRLAAELDSADEAVELVRADAQDECVRVAFQATAPVSATLTDAKGATLAAVTSLSSTGTLAESGPVCVRRGDVVVATAKSHGVDAAPRPRVSWAAWAAP